MADGVKPVSLFCFLLLTVRRLPSCCPHIKGNIFRRKFQIYLVNKFKRNKKMRHPFGVAHIAMGRLQSIVSVEIAGDDGRAISRIVT
jgi:hypothetical protein